MRIEVLDTPIDALTMEETICRAREAMKRRNPIVQVSVNVAKLVNMRQDPELREDVVSSDIISADGMGIVLASRLLGTPLRTRVAGIDLMIALLASCAREGFRPYFLGASEDVVRGAATAAASQFPGLRLAGTHHGYFKPEQEADVVGEIRGANADCLFIGMPTPRKERILRRYRGALNVPFVMGVGGSFDVLAGKVRRAPHWIQVSGLEWAYRIYQEPRRMWWRYARTNVVFGCLVLRALVGSAQRSVVGRRIIQ